MTWAVLKALLIFYALSWIAKKAWDGFTQWREEMAEFDRRERHLKHRNEQWVRAYENRKARHEAWVAAMTPERREKYEKTRALYEGTF
jgi:hypothetical protein